MHIYNSTSTLQRDVVFGKDKQSIIDIAVQGTKWVKERAEKFPGKIYFEYSPEKNPFWVEIGDASDEALSEYSPLIVIYDQDALFEFSGIYLTKQLLDGLHIFRVIDRAVKDLVYQLIRYRFADEFNIEFFKHE